METTRAATIVAPGRMGFVEAPVEPPRDGDLLVRTRYASICGSDLHVLHHQTETDPALWVPGYPGHEGVGEVVESRAPGFAPGDAVLLVPPVPESRCYAEYQRVRAALAVPVDAALPPREVLMAQQLGTVLFAARHQLHDVPGATVAVLGQGSAGLFWTWLLKRAGAARVIVSDLSPTRLAAARGFGADVLVDARTQDMTEAVMDLTGGLGADLVVEAVGSRVALLQSVGLCRVHGRLFCFGLPDSNDPVPFDYRLFFRRKLTAVADWGAQHEPGLASFRAAVEHVRTGAVDVRPLLSHVLPIEGIEEAFRLAGAWEDGVLKVSVSF